MNFTSWENNVESLQTIEVGRDVIRDVYQMPNGIKLIQDVGIPRNIFAKQWENTVVDYIMSYSEKEKVKKAGGELSDAYYTEDDYGTPVFYGEGSLEKAFNFAQTLSEGSM
jgi:hypothetical protein